jgi:hypothetical protein
VQQRACWLRSDASGYALQELQAMAQEPQGLGIILGINSLAEMDSAGAFVRKMGYTKVGTLMPARVLAQTVTAEPARAVSTDVSAERFGNDSAPECRLANPPAFCQWSKERLPKAELAMVDGMRKRLEAEFKTLKPRAYFPPGILVETILTERPNACLPDSVS